MPFLTKLMHYFKLKVFCLFVLLNMILQEMKNFRSY